MSESRRLASHEALRVGFPQFLHPPPNPLMGKAKETASSRPPQAVQRWINLRRAYERQLATNANAMPRVLPIVKIGRTWYFVDERLKENRNVLDPSDVLKW